jgi:hypothetical protein
MGCAAYANLTGHAYAAGQAERMRVPGSWLFPLGLVLGAGALGLLVGLVVPVLGTLAAAGLVLYFILAVFAHLRAHAYNFGPWSVFFTLSAASLLTSLTYHW